MKILILPLVVSTLFFMSCSGGQEATAHYQQTIDSLKAVIAMDHSGETAAIEKLDEEWSAVSQAKNAEGWTNYYTDDAIIMPPNSPMLSDKASTTKYIADMFNIPGVDLKWQTKKASVSRAGDMAYSLGVYQWKSKDAKGKDVHDNGSYLAVYKKQADGTWKCVADTWNSDVPIAQ